MRKNLKKVLVITLIVLITNIILLINIKNVRAADSKDKIHFIKVGSSDSILIESNGHYALIDTSNPSTDNTEEKDSRNHKKFNDSTANGKTVVSYLNKLGVQSLDFIMGTHSHSDHIGGIPDICNSGNLVNSNTTYIYKKYVKIDDEEEGGTYEWYNGDYFSLATSYMQSKNSKLLDVTNHSSSNLSKINAKFVDNSEDVTDYIEFTFQNYNIKIFNLYTVSYTNENTNSLVTLITKGSQKMLFMADMNVVNSTEQKIAKYIGDVDLIKIGHHGHLMSTSLGLLKATTPEIAVLTRGTAISGSFAIPITYFKEHGGKIYKTEDSNTAIVATVGTDDIKLYTYDSAGSLTVTQSVNTEEAIKGWQKGYDDSDEEIWTYINTDGTFIKDWAQLTYEGKTSWYYFGADGVMQTGWVDAEDGFRYYLNPQKNNDYYQGELVKGWLEIEENEGKKSWYYLAEVENEAAGIKEGQMLKGWQELEYKGEKYWFYLAENENDMIGIKKGEMVKNGWYKLPDKDNKENEKGYYFNENGVMEKVDDKGPIVSVTPNTMEYDKVIILTINTIDDGIGLHEEPYSFDGGETWSAYNNKAFYENQKVFIKVRDKLGLESKAEWNINNIQTLQSIIIKEKSTKTKYYVGESLDLSGIKVIAVYDTGEEEIYEGEDGWMCDFTPLTTPGIKTVVIRYEDKDASFEIEVLEVPKEITLESSLYEIQSDKKIIAKIQPNTKISEFKKKIMTNSELIELYNVQNNQCGDSETVKTGMRLKMDNNLIYTLIVTGDVNGDSKTDITDMELINKYRLKEQSLEGVYLFAADVNGDAKEDLKDLMKINKYRLQKIDSL